MTIAQMPLLAALADKMRWHQARQTVLAENVANADTPGFRPRDLRAYSFEDHLRGTSLPQVTTAATRPNHFAVSTGSSSARFEQNGGRDFEVTPSGNAVSLEDEMMKVSANQMDYQTVTSLYSRSMRLLRTALGRAG